MKAFCFYHVFVLFFALLASGCGVSTSDAPAPDQGAFTSPAETGAPPVDNTETAPVETALPEPLRTDDIELRFAIPEEQIDGFVIYYGFSSDAISNEVRVPVADLETVEQPGQGKVYRYFLRELPANQSLYVSLAAFRGDSISPRTDIVEIDAGEPKVSVGTTP